MSKHSKTIRALEKSGYGIRRVSSSKEACDWRSLAVEVGSGFGVVVLFWIISIVVLLV